MSQATPQMRDFAERLIAYETRGHKSFGTSPPAAFPVCEKLRPRLASLMGGTGVHALFLRALTISREGLDSLHIVQVKADGSFETADGPGVQADPEELAEGNVALVAQLLRLLVAFIGENITLGLVREIWPNLSLNDFDFRKGDEK